MTDSGVPPAARQVLVLVALMTFGSAVVAQFATQGVALDDEIEELGRAYQNMAIAGEATDALRDLFVDAGARLVKDHGADAIVLAGTDLGLVFDDLDPGYRVVDALDVHVAELAAIGAGHKPVPAQEIAA